MQGPPINRPKPKRYGWYRRYHIDDTDPKWRLVAARAAVKITDALCVKNYLNDCASKTKRKGHIGDFDLHECAVALDIAAEAVAAIFRVLVDLPWMSRDHVILDWLDRQPEQEDPTAADRQRNKRARDAAKIRLQTGRATEDDLRLLSRADQEAYARFAALSRVTATPAPEIEPVRIVPFVPIVAKEDTQAAREIADGENDRAARRWLFGDGVEVVSYGPGAAILSQHYRLTLMSADAKITDWLKEAAGEAAMLAQIISDAHVHGLIGEDYQRVVQQAVDALIESRNTPRLPLSFGEQRGGRSA